MKYTRPVTFFDLLVFFIACVSYASVLLLVIDRFNAPLAILLGALSVAISLKTLELPIKSHVESIPYALVAVLLIAMVFRCLPYLYVPGGQDQGTYVNMSAVYEKKGSTFVVDDVREKAKNAGLVDWYDAANQRGMGIIRKKQYEGHHLPGIYIKDLSNSEYVFQFYPLHPLWMAIAGTCAGNNNRVYSLVFFSLLSIAAIYLLARELSVGGIASAAIASLFLALNPLHAFFSKFPVTEIMALAFGALGFLYLIRYYSCAIENKLFPFYLMLSSLLFGCMFFTRISGFIYLPFFYFIALLTIFSERDRPFLRHITMYLLSIGFLYALSVIYGLIYSYPYAHDTYNIWFRRFFHSFWEIKLVLLITGLMLLICVLWFLRNRLQRIFHNRPFLLVKQNLNRILCVLFVFIIVAAFYKAYLLAFTERYVGSQWDPSGIGARFNIAGLGISSLNYSNIVVAMWYLSPLGFALLLYSICRFLPSKEDIVWTHFLAFLGLIWFLFTVMKFYTQYQYYYARYLVSELVPYSLLAIGVTLGSLCQKSLAKKCFAILSIVSISLYFIYFTAYQFQGRGAEGAASSFDFIADAVGNEDLVLLYDLRNPHQVVVQTSLSYFYDLNVCNLREPSVLSSNRGKDFLSKFRKVFLISQDPLNLPFLKPVRKIEYKQGKFEESNFIPMEFSFLGGTLYFYESPG